MHKNAILVIHMDKLDTKIISKALRICINYLTEGNSFLPNVGSKQIRNVWHTSRFKNEIST